MIAQKRFTLREIRDFQNSAVVQQVRSFRKDRLLLLMGLLNIYIYAAAKNWDVIEDDPRIPSMIKAEKAKQLITGSLEGEVSVSCSVQWLSEEYLKEAWPGACRSCPAIRAMRRFMRDELWLLEFEDLDVKNNKDDRTVLPRVVENVDIAKMLLVYEVCEKEYLARIEYEKREEEELPDLTEFLPRHKAKLMVDFFNAVFGRIARFGRKDNPESAPGDATHPLPERYTAPKNVVPAPKWKPCYNKLRFITRHMWNCLARKARAAAQGIELGITQCERDWLAASI